MYFATFIISDGKERVAMTNENLMYQQNKRDAEFDSMTVVEKIMIYVYVDQIGFIWLSVYIA